MKKKIGELYNKSIVVGNPNEVTKDEILLKNDDGGIILSERKDGELEDTSNTPPKYPRCFIWYKAESFDTMFHMWGGSALHFAEGSPYIDNMAVMKINNDGIDENGDYCDLDTFLNLNKGKYKEISLKEFMGEYPEGDYGFIDIYTGVNTNMTSFNVLGLVNNNTKKRLNYLSKNPNKANLIRVYTLEGGGKYIPITLNCQYYAIDKENNSIIFETEGFSPEYIPNEIKVSLDAEVVGQ